MKNIKKSALKALIVASICLAYTGAVYSGQAVTLEQYADIKGTVENIEKGVDIDINFIVPVPPQPAQYPIPYPYPAPYPGSYSQILTFESGKFNFAGDAEEALDQAIGNLNAAGYKIMESRRNWDTYKLV
ncbi:MAG: hypothetical protein HY796_07400, partial [Elusimicrobia bacterium]|nr:hypothetical protein [Elusimicrobiota bacterium]